MQSKAATVEAYLAELPADRRPAIEAVRDVILRNLNPGFEEGMQYGMIGYYVPHRLYPPGYHCDPKQPLPFAGLASQKNYMSLYLGSDYGMEEEDRWFRDAWAKSGKRLDMGKCCIRFKKLDDLALDVVAEAIRRVSVENHVAFYEQVFKGLRTREGKAKAAERKANAAKTSGKKAARKKVARKKAAPKPAKRAKAAVRRPAKRPKAAARRKAAR
jgi:hypothetical protein